MSYYQEALEISNDFENIPSPFTNLSILYEQMGNYDESSRFSRLALDEVEKLWKYSSDYALPLMNFARGLMEKSEYQKSIDTLQETQEIWSLEYHLRYSLDYGIHYFLIFYAYDFSGNDDKASCTQKNTSKNRFEQAEYILKVLCSR